MSGAAGVRYLNALKVQAFTAASEALLAAAINDWITANAASRSFVQLDFVTSSPVGVVVTDGSGTTTVTQVFSAFLTFTE